MILDHIRTRFLGGDLYSSIYGNGNLRMPFQLAPRSMTLDDPFAISSNLWRISWDFADLGGSNC